MGRAAFFFGSGISRASGAPMVGEITESLLQGGWWRHTDGRFYPCRLEQGKISLGEALRAQELLRLIKNEIDPHLLAREGCAGNYEDIYAATLQIVQDETHEIVSPLISRSLAAIKAASEHLHVGKEHHIDKNPFASLADRACDLVQWVVYHGLSRAKAPVGFQTIADVARKADALDIFTVNHETLVERQLTASGIPFADGFGERKGDVRIYGARWDGHPVRVLKLHGSTNWYLFRFPEWDQFASVESNQGYAKDEHGRLLDDLDPKPLFLTGTTVKEQSYGVSLIGEIFSKFRELLSAHRTLICCGYGWNDKGINIRLGQWLRDAKENRIVILHADPEGEITRKRFWFWRWPEYVKAGKVTLVPKWLADCTAADLEPFFDT
jgi:SIR2-like domain